ncbi:DUF4265 domain-containing protein [Polyangium jinanense]|uniref:DUF4265 domain-containing protein n=1 Tax=Polyangium jinanense TaxID=2829994 RepID=A0A9X3X9T6_9BACT|nr:DUF4265 domain-containing protein [Polyangium jinanense]MDC3955764.1 DUF4265 domain-containing protein [Polyangium jinanense]MDC3986679.1 DUF4265 domain-containing protein [Polyangium jinanense]
MNEQPHPEHVKILFDVENEDGTVDLESLWAVPVSNGYRIDNIPFYARGVAYNDIVAATPDEGGMLRSSGLVTASGHSTVRLWFEEEGDVRVVRDHLRQMGCESELDLPRLVAVDIPPTVPYNDVRKFLDEQEAAGVLEYEEGCLGDV